MENQLIFFSSKIGKDKKLNREDGIKLFYLTDAKHNPLIVENEILDENGLRRIDGIDSEKLLDKKSPYSIQVVNHETLKIKEASMFGQAAQALQRDKNLILVAISINDLKEFIDLFEIPYPHQSSSDGTEEHLADMLLYIHKTKTVQIANLEGRQLEQSDSTKRIDLIIENLTKMCQSQSCNAIDRGGSKGRPFKETVNIFLIKRLADLLKMSPHALLRMLNKDNKQSNKNEKTLMNPVNEDIIDLLNSRTVLLESEIKDAIKQSMNPLHNNSQTHHNSTPVHHATNPVSAHATAAVTHNVLSTAIHHTASSTIRHLLTNATTHVVNFVTSPAFVHHMHGVLMHSVTALAGHHGATTHLHSSLNHIHSAGHHVSNNLHHVSNNLSHTSTSHFRGNGYDFSNRPH